MNGATGEISLQYGEQSIKRLRVDGVDIHYLDEGTGTMVLLIPGMAGDYRYWKPVTEELSKSYRVLAMSARHHFPSPAVEDLSDYTLDNHVGDLISLIEATSEEPVHLVGHSQGGNFAALVAIKRPDLVRTLVLEEGGFISDVGEDAIAAQTEAERLMRVVPELFASGDLHGVARTLIDMTAGADWAAAAPASYVQFVVDNIHTLTARLPPAPLTSSDIAGLGMSTLMIRGDSSPKFVQMFLDATEASLPTMERVVVPGATHYVHTDNPRDFNRAVLVFLARN
jgi:pimeloyl-ACP methyl ester carboxylesterase